MNPTAVAGPTHSPAGPPPFDPSRPAVPVSYPIKTLAELESRSYFDSFHFPFNKSSVVLRNGRCLADRPRMLVCHDMAGGYTDDKWVQGGSNPEAYAIWHWYLMDVFVYFSHNLVTLPPPCWTNAAHKHGVKVLGTFITEWDEGRVNANKLLATKESARMYAERLTELASALGFDGWLLNMEVNLGVGKIPILTEFVSHLTKTMHALVPGSLVIWYDSVTVDGNLIWQNQLNQKNKPFFDVSDGIFLNYSWLKDYPNRSAAVAGDRKFDVYVGIDIFGRGTYGGGQWNTNVALDVIKRGNVSAALFAPGWVYETKQPPDFATAQNRWWSLVEKSWGIMQSYPLVLPFYSNFDQGRGQHVAIDGGQVSSAPWNNISSQSFQPCLKFSGDSSSDSIQVLVDFKEASYSGGGNIKFKGTLPDVGYFSTKLFRGELLLGDLPVYFTYSAKLDGNSLIGLSLEFSSAVEGKISVLLASRGNTLLTMNQFSSKFNKVIMPRRVTKSKTDPGWVILENSISMKGFTLTEIHALCYSSNPEFGKLRSNLQTDGKVFKSSLSPNPTQYSAILGHISVKTSGQDFVFPPSTSWLVEGQDIEWTSVSQKSKTLSVKLSWRLKDGKTSLFPKYNIFVEKLSNQGVGKQEYLGVAHVEAFYVFNLVVPSGTSNLKFIIQVCGIDGTSQPVKDSPSFLMQNVNPPVPGGRFWSRKCSTTNIIFIIISIIISIIAIVTVIF
ncbi:cytosolic endo-beta-N-acetylglucosaminidase 1-like [Rhododendron vialii]|uniref:cytosolic endo-beta-N-acetylglucosaminidase 1-like n=1 Tax=Rhododendron vialii TaxID=182163 RepID=UPI00265E6DCD|nr:cytosolic endo-beta-N-acetylglucosaminidase 1-like [Rhododendron vialii]